MSTATQLPRVGRPVTIVTPEKLRRLHVLRSAGYGRKEIAAILDLKEGTAGHHLSCPKNDTYPPVLNNIKAALICAASDDLQTAKAYLLKAVGDLERDLERRQS